MAGGAICATMVLIGVRVRGGAGRPVERTGAGGELLPQLTAGPDTILDFADLLGFAPIVHDYCVQQLP